MASPGSTQSARRWHSFSSLFIGIMGHLLSIARCFGYGQDQHYHGLFRLAMGYSGCEMEGILSKGWTFEGNLYYPYMQNFIFIKGARWTLPSLDIVMLPLVSV